MERRAADTVRAACPVVVPDGALLMVLEVGGGAEAGVTEAWTVPFTLTSARVVLFCAPTCAARAGGGGAP